MRQVTFLPSVVKAEYRGGYRPHVTFQDGTGTTIDFRAWWKGPVLEPRHHLDYLRKFRVEGSTIGGPNGAESAPETLCACEEVTGVAWRGKPLRVLRTRSRSPLG